MLPRLRKLAETYPVIAEVRGRGAMIAVELTKPGTLEPDPAATAAGRRAPATRQGLIVLTCGTFGNVLRFLPPLVIGEDLLEEGLDILENAFASVCRLGRTPPGWPAPAQVPASGRASRRPCARRGQGPWPGRYPDPEDPPEGPHHRPGRRDASAVRPGSASSIVSLGGSAGICPPADGPTPHARLGLPSAAR